MSGHQSTDVYHYHVVDDGSADLEYTEETTRKPRKLHISAAQIEVLYMESRAKRLGANSWGEL
jgi:hypothetical protein